MYMIQVANEMANFLAAFVQAERPLSLKNRKLFMNLICRAHRIQLSELLF